MPVKKKAVAKQNAIAVMDIPQNLSQYLKEFEQNLPDDEQALWDGSVHFMNAEILNLIHAGQCFIKLKEKCGHGNFIKALEERNLNRFYVNDRIRIAERLTKLEIPNVDTYQHLGISKIKELIKLEDIQIIDFLQGKEVFGLTLDDVKNMNTSSFKSIIKENRDDVTQKLTQENKRLHADLEDSQEMIDDLKNRLEHQNAMGGWPELVNIVRTESAALSEQASVSLDDLNRVTDKLIAEGDELDESETNAAVIAVVHSLKAIQAKTQIILTTLTDQYGSIDELSSEQNMVQLSKQELETIFARRQLFMNERELSRITRAKEREAKKPKTKGRPRKNYEVI